ncbi:MAG: hypothetical protein IJ206_03815 [Oscillospiraceae bacterium]|nr:hypothetical protein [Oscillospiraceae bacterium]
MQEKEPKLSVLILRAVVTIAVVMAILLTFRLTGVIPTEQDAPVSAVVRETGEE